MHEPVFPARRRDAIVHGLGVLCPAVVYVFGSQATGRARPDSDLDLAFLAADAIDPVTCFELANALSDQLKVPVDLVDLARASTVMAKEVLRTGIPLAVADEAAMRQFEMRTLADYARLNEERQPVLANLS